MLKKLSPDISSIRQGLDIIEERLTKYKLNRKDITKAMLAAEETMVSLLEHADGSGELQLSVRKILGDITIDISVPGQAYEFTQNLEFGVPLDSSEIGLETELTLRNIILKSFIDDLKYRNHRGRNMVRITVVKSKRALLYRTMGAMLLAIVVGVILKSLPLNSFNALLDENLLIPIKTMFMNALKMIVTPVVFFSIVSCIGQFGNLSEMGKIGGKIFSFYMLTTFIATGIGIGTYFLFQPGKNTVITSSIADASSITSQEMTISLKDTIVNIVPSNIVKPFLDADMLQLIFIAVLCGIAVGLIGNYSKLLTDIFEACNELFLKITVLLVKFMPVAAFCSILSMILSTGTETLISVLSMLGTFLVALLMMMIIYCLLMVLLGRLNPIPFLRKYTPTMLQVFSMASSNAALPLNFEVCQKKLGISPKVYSLGLPLGATINMDGTCIYLSVFSLALAQIYGVDITGGGLLSVVISIIVLSIGAPGVPGSGMICLSVLLTQLGVPVEAVGLVMGIDPLIGMLRCMSNCLGDVAASTVVAKKEKLLDMDIYNR